MIAVFILKLSAGITLMWWLMPRKDVTDGFFRIQMRVLLGLTVLAALSLTAGTTWPEPTTVDGSATSSPARQAAVIIRGVCILASVMCYAGTVFWALGRRLPGNICIHALTLACLAALGIHSWNVPNQCSVWEQLLSDYSSAAVLGGVLTAMLLGHWYLTTPTMSISPLSWFQRAIMLAVGFRLVASAWALVEFGWALPEASEQIWLMTRWVGGIAAPMVMALMVGKILEHRNTQSATGVFFAGLILVFMGEMTASLLERQMLIPY